MTPPHRPERAPYMTATPVARAAPARRLSAVASASFRRTASLSADGSVLAYRRLSDGRSAYYLRALGSTRDSQLCEGCSVHAFFSDASYALVQYGLRELVRQDVSTAERTTVLHVEDGSILDARVSWDDRWMTFLLALPDGRPAIYIAPLRDAPARSAEQILVRQDDRILGAPRWSPDGTWLYYMSAADGFLCVWGQRLDATSRKPIGAPLGILHLHGSRSLHFPLTRGSLEVTPDRLVVLLGEAKGNVWMAQLSRW